MTETIPLQTFYNIYKNVSSLDNFSNQRIIDKAHFIRDYQIKPFFNQKQQLLIRPKNYSKLKYVSHDNSTSPSMKNFKGLLNKLSSSNFDALILKIEVFLHDTNENKSELIDTLMCFIKKDKNMVDNYYKIFLLFEKNIQESNIERIWNQFIDNKEWDIPEEYRQEDLYSSNENYDLYCDFKKWSNNIIGFICFWKIHNDIDKNKYISNILIDTIQSYINENTKYKRHMIDIFLEELYVLNFRDNDKLRKINLTLIPSSSKFKIEKLLE